MKIEWRKLSDVKSLPKQALTDFVSLATFDYSFNYTIKNNLKKTIILEKQPANSTRSAIIFYFFIFKIKATKTNSNKAKSNR